MGGLLRFPNINNVMLSGRLVRDIELKYSQSNLAIARMCIATSHYFRDESGNQKEESSFIDVTAFGKTAQICQECLKKGSPVLLEGTLKTRTWTDQNGQNRKFTDVHINKVYPLEREEGYTVNQNNQSQPSNQDYSYQNTQTKQNQKPSTDNSVSFPYNDTSVSNLITEDDVPF